MFGIFKVIFDEYIFIFGTIAIAVASFLIAEFAVKRLNTKLIVSAVSMIIYLISSFILASDGAISYLVFIIFLFAGMISISVFIGFSIDTVFRLIKQK